MPEPWWKTGFANTQMWQAITIEGDKLLFRAYDASGSVADQFVLTRMKNSSNRMGVPSDCNKMNDSSMKIIRSLIIAILAVP
ncbi:MAG: hypothetical protein R2758_05370 [Bacteroidales bacterium]